MKAYPFIHKDPTSGLTRMEEGMDLRDWFAGMALLGKMQQGGNVEKWMAEHAYSMADHMMKAREVKDEQS
jgi:hypothetical protein